MKELRIMDADGATLLIVKVDVKGESFIRSFVYSIKANIKEISLLNEDEAVIRYKNCYGNDCLE